MAAPKTTVWTLEPRTRAKHAILRRYLHAWIPILTQGGFPEVAYVDGFAGPGRYAGGEDGSPLIALKAALDHDARIKGKLTFLFVERDSERARVLQEIVDATPVPTKFSVNVVGGRTFEQAYDEFRHFYMSRDGKLPPTFAFIDPFGWTGTPFAVVKSILAQKSCEAFVTFMYEEINRFIGHPDQVANFDEFFGTSDWRNGISPVKPIERNRFLHDLYLHQLKTAARAKFVRSFQMRNSAGVTDYYLFYATNNPLGLKKMKEAMWKIDEAGEFTFSDATYPNQMVLFAREPRYDYLRQQILERFGGQVTTVGKVEEFVIADTAFRETHYKQHVLRELELADPPLLRVLGASETRRRGTYASPSMRLRFS
jgi:three-Cys-motif partner protein